MLLRPVGLDTLVPAANVELDNWWLREQMRLDPNARPPFDTLLLLISWTLWKERNSRTLQGTSAGIQDLYRVVIAKS